MPGVKPPTVTVLDALAVIAMETSLPIELEANRLAHQPHLLTACMIAADHLVEARHMNQVVFLEDFVEKSVVAQYTHLEVRFHTLVGREHPYIFCEVESSYYQVIEYQPRKTCRYIGLKQGIFVLHPSHLRGTKIPKLLGHVCDFPVPEQIGDRRPQTPSFAL